MKRPNDVVEPVSSKAIHGAVARFDDDHKETKKTDEKQKSQATAASGMVGTVVSGWYEMCPWMAGDRGGVVVDEQMSWGTMWFPAWDLDFMGEDHQALCMDGEEVCWDFDIWDLRNVNQIPTAPASIKH
ncbi:hypothetical protein Droror1_Dr00018984 [Drosera rotundifolia]